MGYTHNWYTVMPTQRGTSEFMFHLETQVAHLLPYFEHEVSDSGATVLHHRSGQAEGFSLGPSQFDDGESCKTGRGLAEVHIVELLWRAAFTLHGAGGQMHFDSDCTWSPLVSDSILCGDSALFLAVLQHRCSDLLAGKVLQVKAVPQAWPRIGQYSDVGRAQRMMLDCGVRGASFDHVLFGVSDSNGADYSVVLQPGTPVFTAAVIRHTQNSRYSQPVLRGLLGHSLQVWVDGRVMAGPVSKDDGRPEVVQRTCDITHLIPSPEWLLEEVAQRERDAQKEIP